MNMPAILNQTVFCQAAIRRRNELATIGVPNRVELLAELRRLVGVMEEGETPQDEIQGAVDLIAHTLVYLEIASSVGMIEFHEQRRMFLILGDDVRAHEEPSSMDHKQWMEKLGLLGSYQDAIRGYADETGVYAYKGPSWDLAPEEIEHFKNHLRLIARGLSLNYDLEVWAGVTPGLPGTRWPGKRKLGRIKEIVQ